MTINVQAVYEQGIFRPVQPVALADGEVVELTVATAHTAASIGPKDREYTRRLQAAASLDEMFALMAAATPLPEGYDLCQALMDNRNAVGERPPFLETPAQE